MKPCGCRVDTSLEKLCDECFNKAMTYGEVKRMQVKKEMQPFDGWLYGVGYPESHFLDKDNGRSK